MGRQAEKGGVLRPRQSGRRDATHWGQPGNGSCGGAFSGIEIRPQVVTGDAGGALNIQNTQCRNFRPLRNGLRGDADPLGQSLCGACGGNCLVECLIHTRE